jgi:uncharacterized protein
MIHKFSLGGFNIVLDVGSGVVHIFDDVSFDVLDFVDKEVPRNLYEKYGKAQVLSSLLEIKSLISKGELFSNEIDVGKLFSKIESPIKSMCLNVAHDCNMRCGYCFASHGGFGSEHALMDFFTAKLAVDFLVKNSDTRKNLEIDFFGGEPLMNFEVIKKTVEYAKKEAEKFEKSFKFTITTNGILLDEEKIDYINKEMHNVVLSLDGRRKINDDVRRTATGAGSYDFIVPNFKKFVKKRGSKNYYIRGTFTAKNLDFSEDFDKIYSLGFEKISIEPVVSKDLEFALEENDIKIIFGEYEKIAKKIINLKMNKKNVHFFHFEIDLNKGPCAAKRLKGCGCGNEYVAVTPVGDIYPCHQFVGSAEFKLGNVFLKNFSKKEEMKIPSIVKNQQCKGCWAKFFCGGGCSANNYNINQNINIPYEISCKLHKKRIEYALMIQAALS